MQKLNHSHALSTLKKTHPFFNALMTHIPLTRDEHYENIYDATVSTILAQQLSLKVQAVLYARLVNEITIIDQQSLTTISFDTLRQLGISSSKANAIKALSQITIDESSLTDYTVLTNTLLPIKGIGPWTVQNVALFYLGFPDIFPSSDLGIQNAFKRLGITSLETMETVTNKAKPYRSTLALILWESLSLSSDKLELLQYTNFEVRQ